MSMLTIIPCPKGDDTEVHKTQGTKVLLDDGSELEGVISIKLEADINDIWKATIVCYPKEVVLTKAVADQIIYKQHGIDNITSIIDDKGKVYLQADVTTLSDTLSRWFEVTQVLPTLSSPQRNNEN